MAADATPSLSELTHIPDDPALGGGVPTPVIDNSHVVDQLNQNARFRAQNVWNKYQQFLQNKTDLFKDIGRIQEYDTLPEDKPILQKQAADIMTDILKDPTAAIGGKGYAELQGKIAKFRSDSMLSKQNNLDTTADKLFLERNPELQTDENMKALSNYRSANLGQRKTVQLQLPTVFDEKSAFEGLLKSTTQPYTEVVGADGKPGKGYIESGNEVNPTSLLSGWQLALQGQKDKYGHSILKAVKDNFDALPDDQKKQYEEGSDNEMDAIKKYFMDRGQQYLNAYFPKGSYDLTPQGTYRFGKKLNADPNYLKDQKLDLDKQKLNEKASYDRANLAVKWANYGLGKKKLERQDTEDLGDASNTIDEATSIINKGVPVKIYNTHTGTTEDALRIADPTLLESFKKINNDGSESIPSAVNFYPSTNQLSLVYGEQNKTAGLGTTDSPTKEIPLDQRTWLKHIARRSFPNKNIGTVNNLVNEALKANGNSLYEMAQKSKSQKPATNTNNVSSTNSNQPVKLSGSVDPKQLRKGQSYSVNGKIYIWDGSHLNKK